MGAGIGVAVSLWSVHRDAEQWVVWSSLATGLTAASGAIFGYGLARWPEIVALGPVRPARVIPYLALLAAAVLTMLAVSTVVSVMSVNSAAMTLSRRPIGLVLVTFAAVAALPVVAGLAAVRELATTAGADADNGSRIEALLAMRRLLAGFLAALGAQVTLATLALGASPSGG